MKIIQKHEKCIGCGSCVAICSKHWEMTNDNKAKPIGAKKINNDYELDVEDFSCSKEAAEACPVDCIVLE